MHINAYCEAYTRSVPFFYHCKRLKAYTCLVQREKTLANSSEDSWLRWLRMQFKTFLYKSSGAPIFTLPSEYSTESDLIHHDCLLVRRGMGRHFEKTAYYTHMKNQIYMYLRRIKIHFKQYCA